MEYNTELELPLHSTLTAIDYDNMDADSDDDDDIYLPSPQDLTCQVGGPPAAYIAQKWAEILVTRGQSLFDRQDIANCVLIVGKSRYFVHWQVLWCRSPTFRRIFDDMMDNGAWDSPVSLTTSHENDNVEDDRETMLARLSKEFAMSMRQNYSENSGSSSHCSSSSSNSDSHSHDQQNLYSGLSERHNHSDRETPSLSSCSDEDNPLPELSVTLSDPEECRFDELLFWLYTNDSERWRASFTPQSYSTILENILQLSLASPQVLEICEIFEKTTHHALGLRGLAQKNFQPDDELARFADSCLRRLPGT